MNKIGVFYGSTTGTTEDVAHRIAEKLNVPNGDIHDASKLNDELSLIHISEPTRP